MSRTLPAVAGLAVGLLLSACAGPAAPTPTSVPGSDIKPALAAPPSSLMTPHGY